MTTTSDALAAQVLLCPVLDDRNDTPSAWQMNAGPLEPGGERARLDRVTR